MKLQLFNHDTPANILSRMKALKTLMLILCCVSFALAQGNPAASNQTTRPVGVVVSLDPTARSLTIRTDAGTEMTIAFEEATRFLRVAPGATTLENATALAVADVTVGDRILARGRTGANPGSFVASSSIVMSKTDLAQKHAAERSEWEKRGIAGVITALDAATKEIKVNLSANANPLVIALAPNAVLRRYAPNSVKFSDAHPSRFEELKVGDQVKALGNANEDRSRYLAEELVAGSFRTIAATIVAVDAAQSTLQLTDLSNNKRLQAQLTADSLARRLSAEIVQMLAARNQPGNATGQPKDLRPLIEKLPPLTLANLKPGDAVILSFAEGTDAARATAVTLLAGIEPLLKPAAKGGQTVNLGSWNLDLNLGVP
jgi:hypothetical protein